MEICTRLNKFPPRALVRGDVVVSYRDNGKQGGLPIVLLHGIGSGSASWLRQLEFFPGKRRLIAWDAPGYGGSSLLLSPPPVAKDYADRLHLLLDGLGLEQVHLVGHSLGALMAASFAKSWPARIKSMTLVDPATGYGAKDELAQQKVRCDRLTDIRELGAEALAEKSHLRLLSEQASEEAVSIVQWNTRHLRLPGYEQAVHMLASANLKQDAEDYIGGVLVLCGSRDIVTPVENALAVAAAYGHATYRDIENAGHAAYVEQPERFNQLLFDFIEHAE